MRTWPDTSPLPSLACAPIATVLPSEDRLIIPEESNSASPSISEPT